MKGKAVYVHSNQWKNKDGVFDDKGFPENFLKTLADQ